MSSPARAKGMSNLDTNSKHHSRASKVIGWHIVEPRYSAPDLRTLGIKIIAKRSLYNVLQGKMYIKF